MTGRELIKALECCDLDKEVRIIISIAEETEESYNLLLRSLEEIIEHKDLITLR